MKKSLLWALLAIAVILLVWLLFRPLSPQGVLAGPAVAAYARTQYLVMGVGQYAANHQGHLPRSLQELSPEYIRVLQGGPEVFLALPGAVLADLPAESIVLFSAGFDEQHHRTVVFMVHPDFRIESQ